MLWSVTATKSSPREIACTASSGTVRAPSEWTVCACRSPASHSRPGAAGSQRRRGRSPGTAAPAPQPGRRPRQPREPAQAREPAQTRGPRPGRGPGLVREHHPVLGQCAGHPARRLRLAHRFRRHLVPPPSAGSRYRPIATCHTPATLPPAGSPGVAPAARPRTTTARRPTSRGTRRPEAAEVEHRPAVALVRQRHPQRRRPRPDLDRKVMQGRGHHVLERPGSRMPDQRPHAPI